MQDRPSPRNPISITPAMKQAGIDAVREYMFKRDYQAPEWPKYSCEHLAEAVYRAMSAAKEAE